MPELLALLRRHMLAARLSRDTDFAFPTAEGKPLYYRNVSRDFATAADRPA
jgi:hypothetical protein